MANDFRCSDAHAEQAENSLIFSRVRLNAGLLREIAIETVMKQAELLADHYVNI